MNPKPRLQVYVGTLNPPQVRAHIITDIRPDILLTWRIALPKAKCGNSTCHRLLFSADVVVARTVISVAEERMQGRGDYQHPAGPILEAAPALEAHVRNADSHIRISYALCNVRLLCSLWTQNLWQRRRHFAHRHRDCMLSGSPLQCIRRFSVMIWYKRCLQVLIAILDEPNLSRFLKTFSIWGSRPCIYHTPTRQSIVAGNGKLPSAAITCHRD